ncbi:hypothetical protein [Dethiobacter alkaliphilus]|uniref:Uncharacterized protein n=1 Tax=Dethiobacter alkaliphilus AHT 1 TaxID=555088 RepID=C0GEL2_DETAL|nr:hypothetical protein [Dethiobacter alkaliphilus]EEG78044.1 hypothetical protein DealDRAFT_0921 [Dethiobacter alkaliphilus AHT 1]
MQETIPLIALIFHSFPEAVAMALAGLIIIGVRPQFGKVLIYGALSALSSYFLRQLGLDFLILLLTLSGLNVIFLFFLFRLSVVKAVSAVIVATFLLLVFEGLMLSIILQNTPLTVEMIMAPENAVLRVLVALPQINLLAATAYIAYLLRGMQSDSYSSIRTYY